MLIAKTIELIAITGTDIRKVLQPLSGQAIVSALVWISCGLAVVVIKVGFLARSSSILWEYVGGLMILFGMARLLWGLVRGSKSTRPGFWSRFI